MWFLLPRYLLKLLLLLRLHLVLLLRIHLDHLRRTSTITKTNMVMFSLADYSLSNLPARTLHSSLFILLLLLLLKSLLKAPLPNIPLKIFKLSYNNSSHKFNQALVNHLISSVYHPKYLSVCYFDSAFCNYMTSLSSIFTSKIRPNE